MQCSTGDKYLAALYYSGVMEITVNGSTRVCEAPLAVAELLRGMALAGKKVAVERNGEIVPRGAHGATLLADGDRLEIVVAVGGG
jgi:sulfur carrier protein